MVLEVLGEVAALALKSRISTSIQARKSLDVLTQ